MKEALTLLVALLLPTILLADNEINKTVSLQSDGAIRVTNVAGSIEIDVWDKDSIEIDADLHKQAELRITGDEAHRVIEVKHRNGRRHGPSDLRLTVPVAARIDASGVSAEVVIRESRGSRLVAESVSGDVDVECASPRIDVESVSGDVDLVADAPTRVSLSSVSGDLRATGLAGEVRAQSVSGDIDLRGRQIDRASLETVSGDMDLELDMTEDIRFDAELLSGEITLLVNDDLDARIEAETFSGSIDTDFGAVEKRRYGSAKSLDATAGGGNGSVRIETYSGEISIRKR